MDLLGHSQKNRILKTIYNSHFLIETIYFLIRSTCSDSCWFLSMVLLTRTTSTANDQQAKLRPKCTIPDTSVNEDVCSVDRDIN